jgi:hypothetical protein
MTSNILQYFWDSRTRTATNKTGTPLDARHSNLVTVEAAVAGMSPEEARAVGRHAAEQRNLKSV